MTAATAWEVVRLVGAWEAAMHTQSPGTFFLYRLMPEEGAGFLLWAQGGDVIKALAEAHKLVACCPKSRYPFWKDVQAILKAVLPNNRLRAELGIQGGPLS